MRRDEMKLMKLKRINILKNNPFQRFSITSHSRVINDRYTVYNYANN